MPGCEGLYRLPACIPADPDGDGGETTASDALWPSAISVLGRPEEFVPGETGYRTALVGVRGPSRRAQGHLAGEEHSPIPARPAVAPSRRRRPHGERECSFPGFRTEEERFTGGGRMHVALPFHCRKPWRSLRKENSPLSSKRREKAIWLILPVVICLSQRLSHACASAYF